MRNNNHNIRHKFFKLAVMVLICIIALTAVFVPVEVNAASKRAKYSYSVKVTNINSNTVLKKGTKIKVAYKAKKKRNGKISNTRVRFKSSNKKVASISKKGVIKAKKKGTTYITVYCRFKPSKKKRIKVRVGTPVSRITVSGFSYLGKGRSAYLKANTNSGATNKKVSWYSNNTSVATVNSSGKVTARGYGYATIFAKAKDGSKVQGARTIRVNKYTREDTVWIAHRGLHTSARENTAEAFKAAGNARFQAAECDIWETAKEKPNITLPALPSETATAEAAGGEEEAGSDGHEGTEPVQPDIPDISELKASIESLPGAGAPYDTLIDRKEDIYSVWDKYDTLSGGLSAEQLSLIRGALKDDLSKEDLLKELFDMYTIVYGYDSMDLVINHNATFSNGSTVKKLTKEQITKKVSYACFLGEYLDICKEYNMIPVIEFKDPNMSDEAVRKAIEIIESKGMLNDVYMISFHERVLSRAKELAEKKMKGETPVTYYLFSSNGNSKVETAYQRGYTGISVRKDVLTSSVYNKAKGYNMGVGTWTYTNNASSDEYLGLHMLSGKFELDFITVDYKTFKD